MRVLVVYGSTRGGTKGIAHQVADVLREGGHRVDLRTGDDVDSLERWDSVVVGGALYASRWQGEARRFVGRNADELRVVPTFFFSSGPLDESASAGDIEPTGSVRKLMRLVGAAGHVTFGGRLEPDAEGFIASHMAMSGDWRDRGQVRSWALTVSEKLSALENERRAPRPSARRIRVRRVLRRVLIGVLLFVGASAVFGAYNLIASPEGSAWAPPISVLEGTPFATFTIPGLFLLLVGLASWVAVATFRRRYWDVVAAVAGAVLTGWIVSQMLLLGGGAHWLQLTYLAIGLATLGIASWLWHERRSRPPSFAL